VFLFIIITSSYLPYFTRKIAPKARLSTSTSIYEMNILRKKMAITLKKLIVFCSLATSFLKNVSSVDQIKHRYSQFFNLNYKGW